MFRGELHHLRLILSLVGGQVLRDLEISLRTNHIEWVREFLSEESCGLDVLIEYLSSRWALTHGQIDHFLEHFFLLPLIYSFILEEKVLTTKFRFGIRKVYGSGFLDLIRSMDPDIIFLRRRMIRNLMLIN